MLYQAELLRRSRAAGRIRTADIHLSEVTVVFTTGLRSRRRANYDRLAGRFENFFRGTIEPDSHPSRGCVLPRKDFLVGTTEVSELFTT